MEKNQLIKELMESIRDGSTTIKIVHTCSWCGKQFPTKEEHESHRVPVTDEPTDEERICPNRFEQYGKVTATMLKMTAEEYKRFVTAVKARGL